MVHQHPVQRRYRESCLRNETKCSLVSRLEVESLTAENIESSEPE